ncbi:hypothetical protein WJR50_30470 [Catalinimonas sp. 4WD22]|uniref:DoxX family protein n=1 Tax=Catalinimonas locisalis TaxID=3133978 RepID=UPI003100DF2B
MFVMLLFTAMGYFMFTEGVVLMISDFMLFKKELIYITAVIEILAAIGLHIYKLRKITAWFLILFFIMILPTNINAAINQLDYQTATFNGPGLNYLWFKIPLQLLFIVWVYFSTINEN